MRTGYEGRGEDWGGGRGEGQHFPGSCSPILLPARPGSLSALWGLGLVLWVLGKSR